jgi:ABC-type proline/glycine betaine transport system permease subunit
VVVKKPERLWSLLHEHIELSGHALLLSCILVHLPWTVFHKGERWARQTADQQGELFCMACVQKWVMEA